MARCGRSHALLSHPGMRYQDLGPDCCERQASTRRQVAHHVGKLGALGFEVTLSRIRQPAGRVTQHPGRLTTTHTTGEPPASSGGAAARPSAV